jgi:hypothetical protein
MGAYSVIDLNRPENQKICFYGDMILTIDKLPCDVEFLSTNPAYTDDDHDGLGPVHKWLIEYSSTDTISTLIKNQYVLVEHHIYSPARNLELFSEFSKQGLELVYLTLDIFEIEKASISWIAPALR